MYGLYNDASDYNNIPYKDIDYNQLWARDGIGTKMYGGGAFYYTFGAWQSTMGFDTHSDTNSVNFANKWGTNATDYKLVNGSKGIDGATDLSTYFTTDILGTTRPIGAAWDMGAFQYSSGVGGGGGTLPTSTLNLTALIEALYVAGGTAMPISPWVTVELHNSTAPYALVDSNSAALNPTGDGIFTFTKAVSGTNYYIVVKSMNTIETWSATAHIFTSGALSYDFTTAAAQAYGSNMVQIGSKWCIYNGDINQDGLCDLSDLILINNNIYTFNYHSVNDLNGDGLVGAADEQFVDKNNSLFIHRQAPADGQ